MLTRDDVLLGFRLILGREPESERTIEHHRNCPSLMEFGRVLRESEEFRTRAARDRVAGGGRPCWVRSELPSGLSLWVDLHDDGVSAGILRGAWEPSETNFILSVVRPGDAVIDVGANLGWYTMTLAQALGPDGHVFAFEPRSDTFAQLERSVQENGFADRCTLYKIALGADEGRRNLVWSPGEMNQGHSVMVASDATSAPDWTNESIRVASLDGFGIERRIRLIKIDVEGTELEVLQGGLHIIERDQPIIVAEAFPKWLRQAGGTDIYSLLHALDDLNYRAHYLTDDGIGGEVHWPITDLDSTYVYYSIVFLGAADRATLLDSKRDGRVRELEGRIADTARIEEQHRRQTALAEERTVALAAEVQRLTQELAAAESRSRLAEQRARAAEFRNLEVAGQALRLPKPVSEHHPSADIEALYRSTSWRVTSPLRAIKRFSDRQAWLTALLGKRNGK